MLDLYHSEYDKAGRRKSESVPSLVPKEFVDEAATAAAKDNKDKHIPLREVPIQAIPPQKYSGFFASSVNLMKAIIGAGMLSLPFALSLTGVIPGGALMIIAATMAVFGLHLLTKAAELVCNRDATFTALSSHTYPRLAPVFEIAIALKCLGVAISYLTIIGDLIPTILEAFIPSDPKGGTRWFYSRFIWMSVIVVAIGPVTFMKRIDSLKYTSFLGLIGVAYLLTLSVLMYIQAVFNTGSILGDAKLFVTLSIGAFRAFPIMVFAFTCPQNILPIQNEAKHNSTGPMLKLINFCVYTALTIYMIFASCSFAALGSQDIQPNIINNYPTNGIAYIVARFLYMFLLTFSYPMVTYPCRSSIMNLFEYFCPSFLLKWQRTIYYTTTTCILAFTWLVASINPPLEIVLGLIGSTAAPLLAFFLPAVFWLKLDPNPNRFNLLRIVSIGMIIFAILSTSLSLASLIITILNKFKGTSPQ